MTDASAKLPKPSRSTAAERPAPGAASEQRELRVVDDWRDRIPVTTAELEAIEIWLRPLLDEIFGGDDA